MNSYWTAFSFALAGFICALKYAIDPLFGWRPSFKFSEANPYGTYPIWILGFMSMAIAMVCLDVASTPKPAPME